MHNSAETCWKGLLSHDFRPNPTYEETKTISRDFAAIGSQLVNLRKTNQEIRFPLVTKSGTNDQSRTVRYYLNCSARPATFRYPHAAGRDLLTVQPVASGAEVQVPSWGVVIVLEDR